MFNFGKIKLISDTDGVLSFRYQGKRGVEREYRIARVEFLGHVIHEVTYRPVNPRNDETWQSRQDLCRRKTPIIVNGNDVLVGPTRCGWAGYVEGWATREDALAAVAKS